MCRFPRDVSGHDEQLRGGDPPDAVYAEIPKLLEHTCRPRITLVTGTGDADTPDGHGDISR